MTERLGALETSHGAHLFSQLGRCKTKLGDFKSAIEYFEESLALREKLGEFSPPSMGRLLLDIAEAKGCLGDLEGELECYNKAKNLLEDSGMLESVFGAHVFRSLGKFKHKMHDFVGAAS